MKNATSILILREIWGMRVDWMRRPRCWATDPFTLKVVQTTCRLTLEEKAAAR